MDITSDSAVRWRARPLAAAVLLAFSAPTAYAQSPRDGFRLDPLIVSARVTPATVVAGQVEAWRRWLPAHGMQVASQFTSDLTHHHNPVERQRAVQSRVLSQVTARADLDSALGVPGLTVVVSGVSFVGPDQTSTLGAVNGGTSIDAAPFRALGEAWVEQRLAEGMLRIKVGRMDANTEFAAAANAGGFLRPGAGLDPTMATVMPTYPLPALGVNAFVDLTPRVRLSGGLYDGQPVASAALGGIDPSARSSRFGIAELDIHNADGRVAIGAWRHTADFTPLVGASGNRPGAGLTGVYAVADYTLLSFDVAEGRTLGAFTQLGLADRRLSDVDRHVSVGLAAAGPLQRRPADLLGVAYSVLTLGDAGAEQRQLPRGARESHVELFYATQVAPWLAAVPNVQLIVRPLGRSNARPAAAFTLRFDITR